MGDGSSDWKVERFFESYAAILREGNGVTVQKTQFGAPLILCATR